MHVCVLSCVRLFVTLRTVAHQAPLSMEFSGQGYWSGLPFPTPEDLPDPGIEPASPTLAGEYHWATREAPCSPNRSSNKPQNIKWFFPLIWLWNLEFSSVQSLWLFPTPWTAACQASLFIINSWSLLKLMSIMSVMPSNHLILCHPLLLPPSILPSIRLFSNESPLRIIWPKFWSFSFSISPSNEYSGLISFRMDWLDLLAVQGTLKSLLQHHSSKTSILQCSAFFIIQLSHPYMTTGKTIALTRWTFVGKVMSPLFKCCLGWS